MGKSAYYSRNLRILNMAIIPGNLQEKDVIIIISQLHFLIEHYKDLVFHGKDFKNECSDSMQSPSFSQIYLGILLPI